MMNVTEVLRHNCLGVIAGCMFVSDLIQLIKNLKNDISKRHTTRMGCMGFLFVL